jgi:hypothetical protein
MTNYKLWAPKCADTHCTNLVGYHEKTVRANGTPVFDWKVFCETHRTGGKVTADLFKLERGCENVDGRYGFKCTSSIEHAAQIDIHHKDGNRKNNKAENLECLCACCHRVVTLINEDHLKPQADDNCMIYRRPDLFEVV